MLKNLFKFVFALLFVTNAFAQQIDRKFVVVEIGTGTWCTYCPGAAMGADDLLENGHKVAVIENHNGDTFANTYSNARNSYYGITGYPTAYFDGANPVVGGSHTASMYASYLPKYNAAIAVPSDFDLEMSYTNTGADYTVTLNVSEPGDYTGENLKVHLVLTESHINFNWQGQTNLNFVTRSMYPDQNGTAYTGGNATITLNFTVNSAWNISNCELVAFVQDNSNKKILQANKLTLAVPDGEKNVVLEEVFEIAEPCVGEVAPVLRIKNLGSESITSMDIEYNVNGTGVSTYSWTGDPIDFNTYATVELPVLTFDLLETNTLDFNIVSVNGAADSDTSNNTGSVSFDKAPTTSPNLTLQINTDNWGEEVSWNIKNSSGTTVESGGNYADNTQINLSFTMPEDDCYTFNLMDSYGDGGGPTVLKGGNIIIFSTSGSYGSGVSQKFSTDETMAINENPIFNSFALYPNPADQTLQLQNGSGYNYTIYDVLGKEILNGNIKSDQDQINISDLSKGSYFFKISDGVNHATEILIVK